VTPLGNDVRSTWERLIAGQSGIRTVTSFDLGGLPSHVAGEVQEFLPPALEAAGLPMGELPRAVHFLLAAAQEAMHDAGISLHMYDPCRAGAAIGITLNCFSPIPDTEPPLHFLYRSQSIEAALLAAHHRLQGPIMAVDTACAASSQAIGQALRTLQAGDADVMLAGGCSSLTTPFGMLAFALLGSLSKANISRPFDANRDGFVMAEGAGIVVLESYVHARARGARIYAELLGYGSTANAYRMTDSPPAGEAEAAAMRMALADASMEGEDIQYVAAHGTSTRQNDHTETLALKQVLGARAYRIPVSSNKSQLGHSIAAAGVLSTILTVLSIQHGIVPPTLHYQTPDPRCDLDYVPHAARAVGVDAALVNAFAFGGHNASLVVGRLRG